MLCLKYTSLEKLLVFLLPCVCLSKWFFKKGGSAELRFYFCTKFHWYTPLYKGRSPRICRSKRLDKTTMTLILRVCCFFFRDDMIFPSLVFVRILDHLDVTWNCNVFKKKCDFHINEESLTSHFMYYISFSE